MRATVFHGPGEVRLEQVPDPGLREPTDALVRITHSCICGSDLWPYRGYGSKPAGTPIGHEFVGVVEDVGRDVTGVRAGDTVIAPFVFSDGTCEFCREGLQTSCLTGGFWGSDGVDGGQGEAARVPLADGTLVTVPREIAGDDAMLARCLALSDVMGTGHHVAASAGVGPGSIVAVVGDGAVGLCAVLAASRLGAERVIALGHHEPRLDIARGFGATDIVRTRGDEAVAEVRELTGGLGAQAVLECVGTQESMDTAIHAARDGGTVGYVGVPQTVDRLDLRDMFGRNVRLAGGVAPARAYLPELLADVVAGRLDPSPVFDLALPLAEVAEGYAAMHERRAIKVLLRP